MQNYLKDTVALAKKGEYEEALKRHLWYHEHALEHEPAVYGVRLSFALSDWKRLGANYPPAIAAMKRVRDESTARLEKGEGDARLFDDVVALNQTLGENDRTLELFRKLDHEQPALARICWSRGQNEILQARGYDLGKKYVGDLMSGYERIKKRLDVMRSRSVHMERDEVHMAALESIFVGSILPLIDLAVASDELETARQIQSQALGVVHDERLKAAIPEQP